METGSRWRELTVLLFDRVEKELAIKIALHNFARKVVFFAFAMWSYFCAVCCVYVPVFSRFFFQLWFGTVFTRAIVVSVPFLLSIFD